MGNTWSSSSFMTSSSPTPTYLHIKDVLALCEDGDLLLAREKLADSALRVGVEFVVARDIQRMQRGQFPLQRLTSLPRTWSQVVQLVSIVTGFHLLCLSTMQSCELLLRYEGILYVVSVGANGLQFVPFQERVATKLPHLHDQYAIRRLRHDIRSDVLSSDLRELAIQIASKAPVSWCTLLPTTGLKISPISPLQHSVDREEVLSAFKELPPLFQRLLKRMLEGVKLEAISLLSDKKQSTTENAEALSTNSPQLDPMNSKREDDTSTALHVALETLGDAEVTARLSAAFVAAVYEHIFLLDPIPADSGSLLPEAFKSSNNENNPLICKLAAALGCELRIKLT
ncbi:Hypothetical protein PHPALM_6960 [Phytophthora palmivora]|uniref:Uncharacterized protein n=1 Tax=Phytophthora palmivora TaxID=4796 RepID=A0A2P4YDJ4_9STRA|nr:Hypothetical protein PHPALM_6960 [Phytophthora palmivora]